MEITLIGWLFFALASIAVFARPRHAATLLGAAIPLPAAAAVVLGWGGGASLLVATVAAAAFAGACLLGVLRENLLGGAALRIPPAAGALVAFTALAIVGAYVLPRVFAGATLVFPLDRTAEGVTGGYLKLPLLPLAPRGGNATQSLYLASSAAVFLSAVWAVRRDPGLIARALWAASVTHLVFAALDIAGWPGMELVRTAAYQIAPAQYFAGFTRVVGGATEPSLFGAISAGLCAWHLWRWRAGGAALHGLAALAMAAMALASLSTTAITALAATVLVFAAGAVARPSGPGFAAALCLAAAGFVAAALWALAGPQAAPIAEAFDALFAEKLVSESGIERRAWAAQSFDNFYDTLGLGAGLGAAKGSGWASAVLGQTGAPGACLIGLFLAAVFAPRSGDAPAKAAAAALLFAAFLSEARVDLGYLFFLAAGATAASSIRTAAPLPAAGRHTTFAKA